MTWELSQGGVRALLSVGALAGVLMAAAGLRARPRDVVPPGIIAVVAGVPIQREEYRRTLEAVLSERADRADRPELRRQVLERMIDETLLVQRALELGLPWREARLRGELTSAMIETVLASPDDSLEDDGGPAGGSDGGTPEEQARHEAVLRAYYQAHPEAFSQGARIHVTGLRFTGHGAGDRAREAARRLDAGEALAAVRASADGELGPLPEGPVHERVLGNYVGGPMARALQGTAAQHATTPLESGPGVFLVGYVITREALNPAPFEQVRDVVERERRRHADDTTLRRWLDRRRLEVSLVRAPDAP